MSASRIVELARAIASNTTALEDDLKANNSPSPSFDYNAPPLVQASPAGEALKFTILDDIDELRALLVGGLGIFTNVSPYMEVLTAHAVSKFEMAKAFAPGTEATYDEIGKKCGLSEVMTRRIVRYAMTKRIFRESRPGVVEHTVASSMLASNKPVQDFVGFAFDEVLLAATQLSNALEKWNESEEPTQTGWNLATGSELGMWKALDKESARAKQFAGAMDFFQQDPGFDIQHIVNNYPWETVGTVVDLGGSTGPVMAAVCTKHPKIRAIVQDLPATVEEGRSKIPPELSDRIQFMAHDFFTEQPVKDADVYMFRWILHDWSDTYVVKILKALAPAMRNNSKLLIWDVILPEPGQAPAVVERSLRAFDLAMLSMFNGREREAGQWPKILQDTDPRYKLMNVKQPPKSNLGLIEVGWQD